MPKPQPAPGWRNVDPVPYHATRLDPKTPQEVATWTSPRGTAAICKSHRRLLGTFCLKSAGNPPGHPRGLEGLALPVPRGHHLGQLTLLPLEWASLPLEWAS